MSGSVSTFSRFYNLLRTTSLTPTKFSALCRLYEIKGVSDASLNRAIQRKDFNHEVDIAVEPLVSRIEDLTKTARPFPIAFDDIEHIKLLLDILDHVAVNIEPSEENAVPAIAQRSAGQSSGKSR